MQEEEQQEDREEEEEATGVHGKSVKRRRVLRVLCIFVYLAGGTTTSATGKERERDGELHSYFNILFLVCFCCLFSSINRERQLLERTERVTMCPNASVCTENTEN